MYFKIIYISMIKNNYFKGLCLSLVLVIAGFVSHAQLPETSFYFNGFLPTAQFNDPAGIITENGFMPMNRTNVAKSASAGLGISSRFGIWCDIGYGQLQPFAEIGILWNSTNAKVRNSYENNALNDQYKATPTTPHYFNIPMMAGLKYRYDVTPIVRPFAEFALGYDAMFITRSGYKNVANLNYGYKPSGAFAWEIGLGTYLGENVSVGIYYYGLGSHRIEYTSRTKENVGDESYASDLRTIGEFAVRFGFHF